MADSGHLKAGRNWSVSDKGIDSLKRDYIIKLDAVTTTNGEGTTFPGVPAIGSAHPVYTYLIAVKYDVREGASADKNTLTVTVNYEPRIITSERDDPEDPEEDPIDYDVEEWGWDAGTDQRELTMAVDNTAVLNSAQDPFDRVPTIENYAPTFTKIVKTKDRRAGAMNFNCKVNNGNVTISGKTFPEGTLLCSCAEKRIIGDPVWKYRYTITLKFRTNLVKVAGAQAATECGWDATVADTGMRAWKDGKQTIVSAMDWETGKMCKVTSPVLFDGHGHPQEQQSQTQTLEPYYFRFAAYERAAIPNWFYSEPS